MMLVYVLIRIGAALYTYSLCLRLLLKHKNKKRETSLYLPAASIWSRSWKHMTAKFHRRSETVEEDWESEVDWNPQSLPELVETTISLLGNAAEHKTGGNGNFQANAT
jgi:hypothetical protein